MVLTMALATLPSAALAQSRVEFVERSGGPRDRTATAGPINALDCPSERWTFRVQVVGGGSAPEVWLSQTDRCARNEADAACVHLIDPTVAPATCGDVPCWTVTIPSRALVDPNLGSCDRADTGYTRLFVWSGTGYVVSPRVAWDTLPPAAPASVTAVQGPEGSVQVSWQYPIPVDSGTATDADTDATTDATDAADASADAAIDAGADASTDTSADDADDATADASSDASADASDDADADVEESDAGRAPTYESLRRFWLVCDPVLLDTPDASTSTTCPSGGFEGLDVNSTDSLRTYSERCGALATDVVSPDTSSVVLARLMPTSRYRYGVVAEDLAGNRSALASVSTCIRPESYTDFWEQYRQAGGAARPECDASPGATTRAWPWAVVAALAVAWRVRRRRP